MVVDNVMLLADSLEALFGAPISIGRGSNENHPRPV